MRGPGRVLAHVALLAFAAGLAATGTARAQRIDPPCVLDSCLGLKPAPPDPAAITPPASPTQPPSVEPEQPPARSGKARGDFDFYVLALSWSPGFCSTGGAAKARDQCASGRGLGFVVHGLWPQYARGFPSDCGATARFPSRQALDSVEGVYPDRGLARYEWTKHGTCTGQSPTDYFADVRRARDAVTVPPGFVSPRDDQTWAPIDVARAFAAVNRGLRPDEMAVTCRQSTLEEVRICFSRDLRGFVPCPEVARASCRTRQITVPAVR